MLSRLVFYHVPYSKLMDNLSFIIDNKINPEIYFDAPALDIIDKKEVTYIASALKKQELFCTFHAPFRDLNLGSQDSKIIQITLDRIFQVFEFIPLFNPKSIVIHSGFDVIYHDREKERWMACSKNTLSKITKKAEELKTQVALENAIEKSLDVIVELVESQKSKYLKMCLDVGHFTAFIRGDLLKNIEKYKKIIGEFHLSDNNGDDDEHLALGEGIIDFNGIINKINELKIDAVITSEPHDLEDILRNRVYLDKICVP